MSGPDHTCPAPDGYQGYDGLVIKAGGLGCLVFLAVLVLAAYAVGRICSELFGK